MAPDHINLVYRKIGDSHVFASKGIKGMVHVGHVDATIALEATLAALCKHVHFAYGVEAQYRYDRDPRDLMQKIESANGTTLAVHIDRADMACH